MPETLKYVWAWGLGRCHDVRPFQPWRLRWHAEVLIGIVLPPRLEKVVVTIHVPDISTGKKHRIEIT
jgi:hypothetical protein